MSLAFKIGPLSDNPSDWALAKAAGVAPTTIGAPGGGAAAGRRRLR
jgi:hypothetical protein